MNPSTGTFTTMDTYAGSIFDPTSLHKYLYANANPVTYVDSSGYFGLTDVVCANAIGDMLFYGISAGIINVGLNLIREIRAANKYGTKVDFAYVITMSFIEGFLVGSFFGGCSILASSLNSAIIQTALGGTSFLFGSISLAQSQNDLENHDYDLMVLDIIFATGGFVAAERGFDSAAEISSAKNTAETVTVPTPENTNTSSGKAAPSYSKQLSGTKVYRTNDGYTNGKYKMSVKGNGDHTTKELYTKSGETSPKSRFMYGVDDVQATFDAAKYADLNGKWIDNKAKVYVEDGYIGVLGDGEPTQWITVSRTDSGYIHGWPAHPPH